MKSQSLRSNGHISKDLMKKFIQIYRKNNCLWDTRSKDYSNRILKKQSYEKLVKLLKPTISNVDKDFIVKKVNTIRCCFRKEHKKVLDSIQNSPDNPYRPTLWYYDLLLFTSDIKPQLLQTSDSDDHVPSAAVRTTSNPIAQSNLNPNQINYKQIENDDNSSTSTADLNTIQHGQIKTDETLSINSLKNQPNKDKYETNNGKDYSCVYLEMDVVKNADLEDDCHDISIETRQNTPATANNLSRKNDEFDIFGTLVATRLRKIAAKNEMQLLCCENIINLALMKGMLSKLTENSTIIS